MINEIQSLRGESDYWNQLSDQIEYISTEEREQNKY